MEKEEMDTEAHHVAVCVGLIYQEKEDEKGTMYETCIVEN